MNRRHFIERLSLSSGGLLASSALVLPLSERAASFSKDNAKEYASDVVIAGGGLGGCAAALAALRNQQTVILTEETDWIGGQATQQGVPPDEHDWIETHGATRLYREFRTSVRRYYQQFYPVTEAAKSRTYFNPGDGTVSKICHEPKVALAVLEQMLNPYLSSRQLRIFLNHKITAADVSGDEVKALKAVDRLTGNSIILTAPYFVDATELGDLLPLTRTEFVTGAESRKDTNELHAPEKADPNNVQAFTMCMALDYIPGANFIIDKPKEYSFWSSYTPKFSPAWSGKLLDLSYSAPKTLMPKALGFNPEGISTGEKLNLWNYRRIINKANFKTGFFPGDISLINWPQNDYTLGNLIGASEKEFTHHVNRAKQLSLSLLYWLQTEAPRPDGGAGWKGLRLREDIMGTEDGLAKYPYIRESRRIKAAFTILEEHVGAEQRASITGKKETRAASFKDSVGVGYYHIDLHPSTAQNNYIDFGSLPFQIPLGALIPQRVRNLLPANKNIGTTHITNGCYRLHPVEWSIGEAVGMLVAFARQKQVIPKAVYEKPSLLEEFQKTVRSQGIETQWPA